jgi:hypothetical protein
MSAASGVLGCSTDASCACGHSLTLSLSHTHIRYTTARTGAETRKTGCAWLKKAIGVYGAFSVMFQFEIEGVEWDKVVSLSVVVWLSVVVFRCLFGCLSLFVSLSVVVCFVVCMLS